MFFGGDSDGDGFTKLRVNQYQFSAACTAHSKKQV